MLIRTGRKNDSFSLKTGLKLLAADYSTQSFYNWDGGREGGNQSLNYIPLPTDKEDRKNSINVLK